MSKRQLIDAIRKHNPSAREQFLDQFAESALNQYLEQLESAARNVVRIGGWSKPRDRNKLRKAG